MNDKQNSDPGLLIPSLGLRISYTLESVGTSALVGGGERKKEKDMEESEAGWATTGVA